jgi:hypothetical protein
MEADSSAVVTPMMETPKSSTERKRAVDRHPDARHPLVNTSGRRKTVQRMERAFESRIELAGAHARLHTLNLPTGVAGFEVFLSGRF